MGDEQDKLIPTDYAIESIKTEIESASPSRKRLITRIPIRTIDSSLLIKLLLMALLFCCVSYAEQGILVVHAKDVHGQTVVGLEIGPEGEGSSAVTLKGGVARIQLAKQTKAGSWVFLQIITSPKGHDLVMVSPWDGRVIVPSF